MHVQYLDAEQSLQCSTKLPKSSPILDSAESCYGLPRADFICTCRARDAFVFGHSRKTTSSAARKKGRSVQKAKKAASRAYVPGKRTSTACNGRDTSLTSPFGLVLLAVT